MYYPNLIVSFKHIDVIYSYIATITNFVIIGDTKSVKFQNICCFDTYCMHSEYRKISCFKLFKKIPVLIEQPVYF